MLTLVNQGTIDANVSTPLIVSPGTGGATNTTTMEASSGGTLDLKGGYTNTGGLIEALAGSTVKLDGAAITGGTLTTIGTGVMESINTATLNGVTISKGSTYLEPDNTNTVLQGTITNNGNIQLNSSNNATDLRISGPVTLTGTGTVTMGNNGANRIYAPNGTDVLTNKETIQGGGQLGVNSMGLINSGTILANQPTALLIQTSGSGFKNTGTLSVSAADFMHVSGGPFTNFSGSTLTGGTYNVTGTLEIDELGSTGGEIVTNAANIILNTPASSFVDAAGKNALTNLNTNATGSSFTITGGQNFTTIGNFSNNGTLTIGASTSKFDVNGNLTNFSGTTLTGGTYNVTGTLQFNGANIVTNAANITLTGASSQIINQSSANGLANFATNAPAATFGITGGRNFTTAGNFTNNGTLTIGASTSKFDVNGNLSNFSLTTLAGGTYNVTGTLQFNGANIVTNAANITLTGASSKIIDQLSANGLANFANNASTGSFTVAGARTMSTSGAFTNSGNLTTTGIGSEFTAGGNFINNKSLTTTGGDSEVATISSATFTNNGTLTVGTGSKFSTGGSLSNFSGTTLTGGTYNVTGTLQFNGANIVTNAANITLTGASSKIIDQLSANGLANFATNASTGIFTVAGGRILSTSGAFTNNGTMTTTGSGSALTAGGNFINTGSFTTTGGDSEVATISSASFTNNGTLTVGSASKFSTGGSLSNFSGTTLTGGTYNLTGMLQFTGANIVTNAANIYLIGSGSKIVDQTGTTDGLRNFANNSATGIFSIAGGRNFITAGGFTNAGTFSIGTGSTFTLGALGNFTQTGGKTTDDGTLSTSGMVSLTGGSLFGKGTVAGALQSSGTITPGDSSTSTGVLTVSKTYTQNSSGVLGIAIGGITPGTTYDQLNITSSASLNGTLNLSLINGFVPAIGNTFEILNASSVSGTFSSVNGTAINASEHFVVSCDTTDCDVTVASGASLLAKPNLAASSTYNAMLPALRTHLSLGSQAMRGNLNSNFIRTANFADYSRNHVAARTYPLMLSRNIVQDVLNSSGLGAVRVRDVGVFRTSIPLIHNFTKLRASFGGESSFLAIPSLRSVSDHFGRDALNLNANAGFKPELKFTAGTAPHSFFRTGFNGLVGSGVSNAAAGLPRNAKALRGNRIEYGFDLLSILKMRRGNNLGARSGPSLSNRLGYLMVTNSN